MNQLYPYTTYSLTMNKTMKWITTNRYQGVFNAFRMMCTSEKCMMCKLYSAD
jgi:hypothetical protein